MFIPDLQTAKSKNARTVGRLERKCGSGKRIHEYHELIKFISDQVERLRKEVKMSNFDVVLWYNLPMYVEMEYDEDLAERAGMD